MAPADTETETYNPWSVVHVVVEHLQGQGLHPALGETGDPGPPAHELLRALGIEPEPEGNRQVKREVHEELAQLRAAFEEDR